MLLDVVLLLEDEKVVFSRLALAVSTKLVGLINFCLSEDGSKKPPFRSSSFGLIKFDLLSEYEGLFREETLSHVLLAVALILENESVGFSRLKLAV